MTLLPGSWLRRLVAHLTTPLFAAVLGWLFIQVARGWDDLGPTILFCYLLWIVTGAAFTLFIPRRGPQRGILVYMAIGGAALLPLAFVFGSRDLADAATQLIIVPLGAAVGAWYWLCAHWRPAWHAAPPEPA